MLKNMFPKAFLKRCSTEMIDINCIRFQNLLGIIFVNNALCELLTHSNFEIVSANVMYHTVRAVTSAQAGRFAR